MHTPNMPTYSIESKSGKPESALRLALDLGLGKYVACDNTLSTVRPIYEHEIDRLGRPIILREISQDHPEGPGK